MGSKMTSTIRIQCRNCDTDAGDGVALIDYIEWAEVTELQSAEEARQIEPDVFSVDRFSLLDWHTHEGLCLACMRAECQGEADSGTALAVKF